MILLSTKTAINSPLTTREKLALYNGMDCMSLFEINSQLSTFLSPEQQALYSWELDLNHTLLSLEFRGCLVDDSERRLLISEYKTQQAYWEKILHQFASAVGYYDYYLSHAVLRFAEASGEHPDALPRSWEAWKFLPLATRRELKRAAPKALPAYHKALKEFGEPTPFNPNSTTQSLRLFYDFFGHEGNTVSQELSPDFPPPYNKTRGISEIKGRKSDNTWGPTADRGAMEKIISLAQSSDPRDAVFWAAPFARVALILADIQKTLGFLQCKLESGYFRASFGAVTETGRLNSSQNAMGYGSNFQNIAPKNRRIFVAEEGYKLGALDLEQAESRSVGAICYRLFGAHAYLDACESSDLHTLVCAMVWQDLPWPEEFSLESIRKYGKPPKDAVKAAKALASQPLHHSFSMRDMAKRLGHGCLTADHEVLTPKGWKSIADLKDNEPLMAWNSLTRTLQWETPTAWTREIHDGLLIEAEGQSLSMLMTPDHRVPFEKRKTNGYHKQTVIPAVALHTADGRLPATGDFIGGGKSIPKALAQLHTAFQADGSRKANGAVTFTFKKTRKVIRMRSLLQGLEYSESVHNKDTTTFYIPKRTADLFVFGGKIAGSYLLDWDRDSLLSFANELFFWDGCLKPDKNKLVYTTVYEHALWLQTILSLLGHRALLDTGGKTPRGKPYYKISLSYKENISLRGTTKITSKHATTCVYCPTVPSGGFLFRRNEKIGFSLNSNYFGKPQHMAKQTGIPLALVQRFQSAYFAAFPELPQWHQWVITQLQTTGIITTFLGRRRRFFGRPNDEATWREAIAYEPQSVATGDYTNRALISCVKEQYRLRKELGYFPYKMFLQKHDELGFAYLESHEALAISTVKENMEQHITLTDPAGDTRDWYIPTDILTGWNLGYASDKNPDGLAPMVIERTRKRLPNQFLNMRF